MGDVETEVWFVVFRFDGRLGTMTTVVVVVVVMMAMVR